MCTLRKAKEEHDRTAVAVMTMDNSCRSWVMTMACCLASVGQHPMFRRTSERNYWLLHQPSHATLCLLVSFLLLSFYFLILSFLVFQLLSYIFPNFLDFRIFWGVSLSLLCEWLCLVIASLKKQLVIPADNTLTRSCSLPRAIKQEWTKTKLVHCNARKTKLHHNMQTLYSKLHLPPFGPALQTHKVSDLTQYVERTRTKRNERSRRKRQIQCFFAFFSYLSLPFVLASATLAWRAIAAVFLDSLVASLPSISLLLKKSLRRERIRTAESLGWIARGFAVSDTFRRWKMHHQKNEEPVSRNGIFANISVSVVTELYS